MMNNRIELIGRLTKDPELLVAKSGTAVCNFTLAVQIPKNAQKDNRTADFISITAFGRNAEVLHEYCHKGEQIGVAGRIANDHYVDEKTGTEVYRNKIFANEIFFLTSKKKTDEALPITDSELEQLSNDTEDEYYDEYVAEDGIPF